MFAILIVVSLTLHGHHHSFTYTSKRQYSESACNRLADAMAERISRRIAWQIRPTSALVKPGCKLLVTRPV